MSKIQSVVAVLFVCIIAAAFGFPYLFPVTILAAFYSYSVGRKKPNERDNWKIPFWASVITSIILIADILWFHPSEIVEPTQTPWESSDWQPKE